MNELFIQLKDTAANFVSNYPMKVGVVIDWPRYVTHKGHTYWWYNKVGTKNRKPNEPYRPEMPSACYKYSGEHEDRDERLWLDADGTITED